MVDVKLFIYKVDDHSDFGDTTKAVHTNMLARM